MKNLFVAVLVAAATATLSAQSINGLWDAKASDGATSSISFPLELSASGGKAAGSFFNGDVRLSSISGTFDGAKLHLDFGQYDAALDATIDNGVLKGTYGGSRGSRTIEAHPHLAAAAPAGNVPSIGGVYTIPHQSAKGEKAWRFIVRQNGATVSAAILRVDGDTGTLRGTWQGDRFVLSIFDGTRASSMEVVPQADSTLSVIEKGRRGPETMTAYREDVALAKGLPQPTDPTKQTRMKNPAEPFRFSFPDLTGRVVSNTDAQFRNKVVIVAVTGTWCPNCHDEAPFLETLYQKYHSLGLEIVALDFEDAGQLKKLTRLPAFLKKYDIHYTYLLAGDTKEVHQKVPQVENLSTWPASFYIGRDGKVREIHAGFAADASGGFHTALVKEVDGEIERLLAEKDVTPAAD